MTKKSKKAAKRPTSQSKKTVKSIKMYLGLIIAVWAFLIYSNTLNHGYALDDSSALIDNYVTKQGVKGIPTLLTKNYRYGFWNNAPTLYRPLSQIMLAIEWQISPDNPSLYHLINVLLFGATGFLLFYLLSAMLDRRNVFLAFCAALLFVAHPLHVEVVANIKSRDEILAFLFGLLAIWFLLKHARAEKGMNLVWALLSYGLAMFSKENLITFLAIFPLVLYFFTNRDLKKIATWSAMFLIPAGIYLLIRNSIISNTFDGRSIVSVLDNVLGGEGSWFSKLPTTILLLGKYLKNLILPHPLAHDYGYNAIPLTTWGDWRVLLSLVLHIALVFLAFINLKKRKLLSFLILFYFITFSIYTNLLLPIGSSYGDRFLYISSLAFCIGLSWLILKYTGDRTASNYQSLGDFFSRNSKPLLLAGVFVLAYSAKTFTRNPAWKDSLTLYETDSKLVPNSAKTRYHLGLELAKRGAAAKNPNDKKQFIQRSIGELQTALSIYPRYHDAFSELGLNYFRSGDSEKALENYQKALEINPQSYQVYSNMGIIYFNQQNLAKAQEVYEKAIGINPKFVDARRNLGSVYAIQRQYDKALVQFQEGLKYEPNSAILNLYMGNVLRDKGDPQSAQSYFDKAYQLDPSLRK